MAKIKASRLLKVRDAVATLAQMSDLSAGEKPKKFEELSAEEQDYTMIVSTALVSLFDGLFDRNIKVSTGADRR